MGLSTFWSFPRSFLSSSLWLYPFTTPTNAPFSSSCSKAHATTHPNAYLTAQNSTTSPLHALPAELLLHIDTFLPSTPKVPRTAKMAFRATCRRFYIVLPLPMNKEKCARRGNEGVRVMSVGNRDADGEGMAGRSVPIKKNRVEGWSDIDRRAYSQLLARARFRRLCEAEREHVTPSNGDVLVCCLCEDVHRVECFSAKDRGMEPEIRVCLGVQGVLEICPHLRVTWMALRVGGKRRDVVCSRGHGMVGDRDSLGGSVGSWKEKGCAEVRLIQGEGGIGDGKGKGKGDTESKIRAEFKILEISRRTVGKGDQEAEDLDRDRLSRKRIIDAVSKSAWRICPHIHTANANTWLPDTIPISHRPSDNETPCSSRCGYGHWCRFIHSSIQPAYSCPAPDCDTKLTLFRSSIFTDDFTKDYLSLRIDRKLGMLARADDKRWMAQITEVSQLEEDRSKWQQLPSPVEESEEAQRSDNAVCTTDIATWRQRQQPSHTSGPFRLKRCVG
ncbi:hypothetical protein K491DRAFT_52390 [Lophiostoma macrostomum CBS 122681]|uniref:F-box domain-containing protein n=1 Tax=Lophiostoma macrostomum CBS 122681 TaxID=1314788 RepID=A0A6A6SZ30_9PLEO|nr:hypothetical protein K491DRAFT_52390 [Lophiostoma macrostomum CBS 122681]